MSKFKLLELTAIRHQYSYEFMEDLEKLPAKDRAYNCVHYIQRLAVFQKDETTITAFKLVAVALKIIFDYIFEYRRETL